MSDVSQYEKEKNPWIVKGFVAGGVLGAIFSFAAMWLGIAEPESAYHAVGFLVGSALTLGLVVCGFMAARWDRLNPDKRQAIKAERAAERKAAGYGDGICDHKM